MPPAYWSFTWHPPAIGGSALYFSLLSWAQGLCFIHLCLPPHPSLPHHCVWATWDHTIFLSSFFLLTPAPWCSGTDDKWPTPPSHHEFTGKSAIFLDMIFHQGIDPFLHVCWVFSDTKLVAFNVVHARCLLWIVFSSQDLLHFWVFAKLGTRTPRLALLYPIDRWRNWGPKWENGRAKLLQQIAWNLTYGRLWCMWDTWDLFSSAFLTSS